VKVTQQPHEHQRFEVVLTDKELDELAEDHLDYHLDYDSATGRLVRMFLGEAGRLFPPPQNEAAKSPATGGVFPPPKLDAGSLTITLPSGGRITYPAETTVTYTI
jgi:hypothetical protein